MVALDLPGYGLSDKADVSGTMSDFVASPANTMDALSVERVDVIGISMGGQIALALNHPDRVRRPTLLSPATARSRRARRSRDSQRPRPSRGLLRADSNAESIWFRTPSTS